MTNGEEGGVLSLSVAFLYSNLTAPPQLCHNSQISILLMLSLPPLIQVCSSRKHLIKLLTISGKVYYSTLPVLSLNMEENVMPKRTKI